MPKPEPPASQAQQALKLTLMSARRSSIGGAILVALPGMLIFLFFLQHSLHLLPGLTRWLASKGNLLPLPQRAIVAFLFLVGFPLLAVILNLLAITWFHYDGSRKELTVTLRLRWLNVAIVIAGSALAAFYVLHLLADTILGNA